MMRRGSASARRQDVDRARLDGVPPEEFFRMLRRQYGRRGELRLAIAVLEDAVRCLDGNQDPWKFPPRLFRWEAAQWIESRDRAPLFSFENVCSVLTLDADRLREQVRRWRARSTAGCRPGITHPRVRVARTPSISRFGFRIGETPRGGIIEGTF